MSTDNITIHQPHPADEYSDDGAQRFVHLDNANAGDNSIYDKLSEPRYNPEAAKIAAEAAIGTLDDNVDITDPNYNDQEAQTIEQQL